MIINSVVPDHCCDDPSILNEDGLVVCQNCGVVFSSQQIVSQYRSAYDKEQMDKRVQHSPKINDWGQRCLMSYKDIAALPPAIRKKYSRLAKYERSMINSIERNFSSARNIFYLYIAKLPITSQIKECAWRIYMKVVEMRFTRGRSIEHFLGSAIYVASKVMKHVISIEEIIQTMLLDRRSFSQCVRIIVQDVLPKLGLKYEQISMHTVITNMAESLKLPVPLICQCNEAYTKIAKKMSNLTSGKNPKGLAAAVIYLICRKSHLRYTQGIISSVAEITEVTLRNRAKQIAPYCF